MNKLISEGHLINKLYRSISNILFFGELPTKYTILEYVQYIIFRRII